MHLGEERHLDGTCSFCICRCRWREEIRRRWESRLRMWSAGVRAPEYHLNPGQPIRSQQIPTWSSLTNETLSNQLLRVNTAQWALSQRHRQEMQVGEKLEGLRHYKSGSPTHWQEQRRCHHLIPNSYLRNVLPLIEDEDPAVVGTLPSCSWECHIPNPLPFKRSFQQCNEARYIFFSYCDQKYEIEWHSKI